MDQFGFEQLDAWRAHRELLPPGPLFCVVDGQTRGRRWAATAARAELRQLALDAGVRRRFAPHQLRHEHAVELAREGVAVNIIQRQLGHTDLGTTSTYLQGIDPSEIIDTVRSRRAPTIPAPPDSRSKKPPANGINELRRPPARRQGAHRAARLPLRPAGAQRQKPPNRGPVGDKPGAAGAR